MRPPLANELFVGHFIQWGELGNFPQAQPIVPYLQNLPDGESVERVLERLREEAEEYPRRHQQLAAIRYYLHLMIWACENNWKEVAKGITNYKTLLDQIERWRKDNTPTCLVSFNYDTLLENALSSVGIDIRHLDDYISSETYKLVKLHGSVNWAREVTTPIEDLNRNVWLIANELVNRAPTLEISQNFRIVNERPIAKADTIALFPALAIPVETKKNYECPNDHLDILEKAIPQVTKLLLIGWRAAEAHFLALLRDRLVRNVQALVVAGSEKDAHETIERLRTAGIRGSFQAAQGGFSEFILRRDSDEFLRS